MFNDILGKKNKPIKVEVDKDSIIDAQRANIEAKQELIEHLLDQVTELERIIESQNHDTHAGI